MLGSMAQLLDVPPGPKGVVADETAISDVRGGEGFDRYRQYDAIQLSRQRTFEEVWCLPRDGELPSPRQLTAFTGRVAKARALPPNVARALPVVVALTAEDQPLQALCAAFELMALDGHLLPWIDIDDAALDDQPIMTAAVLPTRVVALYRLKRGQHLIEPRPDLGHAANYMYMLTGQARAPARERALESYLTSAIDPGFNASTFTAQVVASTGTDLGSAVIAVGSLSGPLHGVAHPRALDMLDAIGAPDRADRWVSDTLTGGKLMGFGQPVYRTTDPCNTMRRAIADELGGSRLDLAAQVELGSPRHRAGQAQQDNPAQRPLRAPGSGRQAVLFRQDSNPTGFEVRGVVIDVCGTASVSWGASDAPAPWGFALHDDRAGGS